MSGANSDRRSTTFVDLIGKTWDLSLNVEKIERVRALVDVDLLDLTANDLASRLNLEDVLLAQIAAAILEPELVSKNIAPGDFADWIADGDVLNLIYEAVGGAIVNFTRSPRRAIVAGLLDKARAATDRAAAMAEKRLTDGTIDRMIDEELAKADAILSSPAPGN